MGRPKEIEYGVCENRSDPDDEDDNLWYIGPAPPGHSHLPDHHYWIANKPGYTTSTDDPEELKTIQTPLAEFGWTLERAVLKQKLKREDTLILLLHEHPKSTLGEICGFVDIASSSLYIYLTKLVAAGKVLKEYKSDGRRLYSALGSPPNPFKKYLWCVVGSEILIGAPELNRIARLDQLKHQLAPFGWVLMRRQVGKTNAKWNMEHVADEDIITAIENEPGISTNLLSELYRPLGANWTTHEAEHANDNMRINLYRLTNDNKIVWRNGLYYPKKGFP